jgi:hypothetical protein
MRGAAASRIPKTSTLPSRRTASSGTSLFDCFPYFMTKDRLKSPVPGKFQNTSRFVRKTAPNEDKTP